MTEPVILYGTQSNGETLPVQVDATGRLVAEGLQGEQGPEGPPGPPGPPGECDLPPNPQEGQVLGWENGQLAWLDNGGGGSLAFSLDLLVIGGGGEGGSLNTPTFAGGGAGGMFHTIEGEMNPNGEPTPGPFLQVMSLAGSPFTVKAGLAGDNSYIDTGTVLVDMAGGGVGGNQGNGASGGGGVGAPTINQPPLLGGVGIEGQGSGGSNGGVVPFENCTKPQFICDNSCVNTWKGGNGGGAGAPWQSQGDMTGLASSITGSSVVYCTGGPGMSGCDTKPVDPLADWGGYGSGGYKNNPAKHGVVYLKVPSIVNVEVVDGSIELELTTTTHHNLYRFTAGIGSCRFIYAPETTMRQILSETQLIRSHSAFSHS